jgi:chromosome segregation ATPase
VNVNHFMRACFVLTFVFLREYSRIGFYLFFLSENVAMLKEVNQISALEEQRIVLDALNKDKMVLERERQALIDANAALEQTVQALTLQNQELENEHATLRQQIGDAKQRIASPAPLQANDIMPSVVDWEQAMQGLEQLDQELRSLKYAKDELEQSIQSLQHEKATLGSQSTNNDDNADSNINGHHGWEQEKAMLMQEQAVFGQEYATVAQAKAELEQVVQTLEQEKQILIDGYNSLELEKLELANRMEVLEQERKGLDEQAAASDAVTEELIQRIALFENNFASIQAQVPPAGWQEQLEALEAEKSVLCQEKSALEQEFSTFSQVMKSLEDERTMMEQKNKAMEHELVKTVGRTSEYEHRATMMETQLKQMKSKWEDATAQIAAQEKSVTNFRVDIVNFQTV